MTNDINCSCCCCAKKLIVRTVPENSIAGKISLDPCRKEGGWCSCMSCKCCGNALEECCKDYFYCYDILSTNDEIIYTVYLLICCIKCLENFGPCHILKFVIKNPEGVTVGKIYGNPKCCQLFGLLETGYSYTIKFPENATVQMKLTLINAAIFFDLNTFS